MDEVVDSLLEYVTHYLMLQQGWQSYVLLWINVRNLLLGVTGVILMRVVRCYADLRPIRPQQSSQT